MRIFHKFNLILILVIVTVVSIYSFWSITAKKRYLMREMKEQATYFAETIALGINSASFLDRRDLLVDYLDRMIPESKGWIRYGVVSDLTGYAWIHTVKEMEYGVLSDETSRDVLKNIGGINPLINVYYSSRFKGEMLDIATLITVYKKERGILRLGFSFEGVQKKIDHAILQSVIVGFASIIIGVILSTIFAKFITKPVSRIVACSRAVADGNLDMTIFTGSNIVEIRELEQSIERMKRDLKYVYLGGTFADFRHSIKSDLGLISANIQFIRQSAGSPEKKEAVESKAHEIMKRIDFITSEVNKYKEYRKPQDVEIVEVDINDLLSKIARSIRVPQGITLEEDYQDGAPKVRADYDHLKKALANIIINAIESMPDGGSLRIATRIKGDALKISVVDTGCGISQDDLAKIFKPSYSTKKRSGGEGIGLAMAKIIIEDVHDGRIEVKSEKGKGTTFEVML